MYAKPLTGWESFYTLTNDELEAIAKARGQAGIPAVPSANGNGKV